MIAKFVFLVLSVLVNCESNPSLSFEDVLKAYAPEECPTPCPSPACPAPNLTCPKVSCPPCPSPTCPAPNLSCPTRDTTKILTKMRTVNRKIGRMATTIEVRDIFLFV